MPTQLSQLAADKAFYGNTSAERSRRISDYAVDKRQTNVPRILVPEKEETKVLKANNSQRRQGKPQICMLLLTILTMSAANTVNACTPQYERELRYLNYYMGVMPANDDGVLNINVAEIDKYVERSSQLNCDLKSACLWTNAPMDGLLDTSEFFLFDKVDTKPFPIQIRPGNSHPNPGTLFLLAGNNTNEPQSAVLMSAPVLCQNSDGILTFEYWLYNRARIEVLLLRVNTAHGRLHVLERPIVDCQFFKMSSLCRVEIHRSIEPFRLGIRAYSLNDATIGSFAMINGIRYEADVCSTHEQPKFFNGIPLTHRLRQIKPINTASELNCGTSDPRSAPFSDAKRCLWAAATPPATSDNDTLRRDIASTQWAIGHETHSWKTLMRTDSRPNDEFLYQYIDPMADVSRLPQLRSVLVPCTRTSSTLSFKYWLSPDVQAQLCTLSADNTPLSCVYLNDADSPGPVRVDVDAADSQPFRFAFNVIKFASSKGGIIALDELEYTGRLCHEDADKDVLSPEDYEIDGYAEETFLLSHELTRDVTPSRQNGARQYSSQTSSRQSVLETLFNVQAENGGTVNSPVYSPTLDCDFDVDVCAHWTQRGDDENETGADAFVARMMADNGSRVLRQFHQATVPEKTPFPHLTDEFQGNVAMVIFDDTAALRNNGLTEFSPTSDTSGEYALLTSPPISCAHNARLIISYYSSGDAALNVCAEQHCIRQRQQYGNLSVTISSHHPFRLRILALSQAFSPAMQDISSRRRYAPSTTQRYHARAVMELYRSQPTSNRRRRPFRYRHTSVHHGLAESAIEQHVAATKFPSFILIQRIYTEGGFCQLETPTELACKTLSCDFNGSLCGYESIQYGSEDSKFVSSQERGAVAYLSAGTGRRAILRSPSFRLDAPADLHFDAALATFGARLYVCPGDFSPTSESVRRRSPASRLANAIGVAVKLDEVDVALETSCQLLLGPKLIGGAGHVKRMRVALDAAVKRFAFVALHDAFDAFGDAHFLLRNIKLIPENGVEPLC